MAAALAVCMTRRYASESERWESSVTRTTMESFPPLYRLWVSKHVAGFFGCGKMMQRWKFWDHSRCPCCADDYEDKRHLMTCPDPQAISTWEQSIEAFELWLTEADTDPDIADCFLFALASRDPTHDLTTHAAPHVLSAAAEQTRIGWMLLTEGKIARSWGSLQDRYYRSIGSQRTGRSWAKHLITHILSMTHTQWTHRNSVLHDRDERGLRREERETLEMDINNEFEKGLDGLHERDHHLITRGQPTVASYTPTDQRHWLAGIRAAREAYESSMASEIASMQATMAAWLHPN